MVCKWFTTAPSFCSYFLHQGQKVRPPHCHRALGKWMPLRPIIFRNSMGVTTLKRWMSLGEVLATQLAACRSFQPLQLTCTLWISIPRRLGEVAICQKIEERSYDPSCLKLSWQILWYICPATLMTSDSLEKASQQGYFITLAASLPSLCFWQGQSSGMLSSSAISSSSYMEAGTPWS